MFGQKMLILNQRKKLLTSLQMKRLIMFHKLERQLIQVGEQHLGMMMVEDTRDRETTTLSAVASLMNFKKQDLTLTDMFLLLARTSIVSNLFKKMNGGEKSPPF